MLLNNSRAVRAPYDASLARIMNIDAAHECRRWLAHWPGANPEATPLRSLPDLASRLGIERLHVKDESVRADVGSFKALGAPIALVRLILRTRSAAGFDARSLFAGEHAHTLRDFTVISATDGNHGRALAAAARSIGCRCVIVLHQHVSPEREAAIAAHSASIRRVDGDYDASVREAQALAGREGWLVVSDTSYAGYEDVPRDVMQGYGVIAAEAIEQAGDVECPYSHVFLQGGVGGLPAGVFSYFWERYGARRPTFVVVEPEQADCLFQSAAQGHAATASGSVDSVMAGLACGEASPLAWRFLEPCVDAFMTLPDQAAVNAMRSFAAGSAHDIPIVSGESGAAGLAALEVLADAPDDRVALALGPSSRVLLINSEGATAPSIYETLCGEPASAVLARQAAWVAERG